MQEKRFESNKISYIPTKRARSAAASYNHSSNEISLPQQNPNSAASIPPVPYRSRKRANISDRTEIDDQFDRQFNLRNQEVSNPSLPQALPQALNSQRSVSSTPSRVPEVKGIDEQRGKISTANEKENSSDRQSATPASTRRRRREPTFILEIDSTAYLSRRSKSQPVRIRALTHRKSTAVIASASLVSPELANEDDRGSDLSEAENDESDTMEDQLRFERETRAVSPESNSDEQKPNSLLPITSTSRASTSNRQQLPTPSPDVELQPLAKPFRSSSFSIISRSKPGTPSQAVLCRPGNMDARQQNTNKPPPSRDKSTTTATQTSRTPTASQSQRNTASPALIDSPSLASHLLSFDPILVFAARDSSKDLHLDFLAPLFCILHYDTIQKLERLRPRDAKLVIRNLKAAYEKGGSREGIVEELDWDRMEEGLYEGFGKP